MDRSADWMAQAEHMLSAARHLKEGGFSDGACFQSQQAALVAIDFFRYTYHTGERDRPIVELLDGLNKELTVPEGILKAAIDLDRMALLYLDPHSLDDGSLDPRLTVDDANRAIDESTLIIEFAKGQVTGSVHGARKP
jgi:HEPN domain-containing protein